ncbi:MAG: protein kinase domain-containing protein [Acidobacteriota bacterium]
MALASGRRLGPYEVVGPIGAGGMGEVYRARDTRLDRDVALKVLPPDVSADPARRKRFEIEARAVAALSHSHICPIHDVGSEDGLDYLVLELVHGETLAARLKRGPMPVAEALARAGEMAAAIAAAHRRGIVHRDLKPGNVMLTKSGAMILDFGLARIVRDESAPAADAAATTMAGLTEAGVVLGTPHYMAPEQIEGHPADARTDVFAFGTILYEMLTGRRAFDGSSAASVMGAILRAETPSAVSARPELPESLDRLIRACLVKDPTDRIASMHDVQIALGWVERELSRGVPLAPVAVPRTRRTAVWLLAGIVAAIGLGIAGYLYGRRSAVTSPPQTFVYNIPLPPRMRHWAGIALSPDGKRLALVTQAASASALDPRLWIRDLDSTADWQLVSGAGDEVPHYPFWSPDGRYLAFFLKGRLVRVEPPSMLPIDICPVPDGRGGVWLDDGTIIFAPTPEKSGLMRVDSRGGTPEELVGLRAGEMGLKYPSAAGDGRLIYWAQLERDSESEVRLVSLADPKRILPIVKSRHGAVFDRGTLFYLRAGLWVGQPFDPASARLSGEPRPVTVDVPWFGNVGAPVLSAEAGHVAARSRGFQIVQPTWFDRTGNVLGILGEAAALTDPDISADGRHLAVARIAQSEADPDIWILDVDTGGRRRLTTDARANRPIWRDDRHIAFASLTGVGGNNNIFEVDADDSQGSQTPKPLAQGAVNLAPAGWLPDGRLVFLRRDSSEQPAAYPRGILIREPGGAATTPFRVSQGEPDDACLSLDGTRIAFIENGFDGPILYVDTIPQSVGKPIAVWHGAGLNPRWRPDGRELYFVDKNRMMVASVSGGPALTVGMPAPIFNVPSADYAIDPRTGRFLVMVPKSSPEQSVTITLNWRR